MRHQNGSGTLLPARRRHSAENRKHGAKKTRRLAPPCLIENGF